MFNFDFYNPTHILFGKDRLPGLDSLIPGGARVLVTYGGGSAKKTGLLDKVKAALGKRTVVEFGGIEPNPHFSTLMKAVAVVREKRIDFMLAVGGGSVIDGTKFISLAAYYNGDATDLLHHGFGFITAETVQKTIPFGTVLTLPATGSEMNCGAVISHEGGKYPVMSPLAYPKFSILDPTVTYTLPKIQVANGIVDTFIHTTEQYITFPAEGRLQDRMAEGILQTLIEIGAASVNTTSDYDVRANHMWCSTMALNSLISVGVPQDWATHMIGHELTALFGIDHGQTLAIVYPALLEERREQKHAKLVQYAERVWGLTDGSDDAKIDRAIAKTREFFESLGIKTHLSDYGITQDKIPLVVGALRAHGMTALSETGDITPEISGRILHRAL
jgi:NADP-dependent alcohol dehydrogenase